MTWGRLCNGAWELLSYFTVNVRVADILLLLQHPLQVPGVLFYP